MERHKWVAALAAAGVFVTGVCNDSTDTKKPETFSARLNGANERPNPVSTTATGTAQFTVNGSAITYTITYAGLSGNPSGAHIHAPSDVNGTASILVPFGSLPASTSGTFTGTIGVINNPAITTDSLLVLMRNGKAYTNIHSATYPGGEIRGQITKP